MQAVTVWDLSFVILRLITTSGSQMAAAEGTSTAGISPKRKSNDPSAPHLPQSAGNNVSMTTALPSSEQPTKLPSDQNAQCTRQPRRTLPSVASQRIA